MITRFSPVVAVSLILLAAPGVAQTPARCGPGVAFGITEWRAAQVSIRHIDDSTYTAYSFGTEPVVVQTSGGSNRIRPGDVVVAVNRQPITTQTGAHHFAYPAGDVVLTVRRGGANIDIEHLFAVAPCASGTPLRWARGTITFPVDSLRVRGTVTIPVDSLSSVRAGGRGGAGGRAGGAVAVGGGSGVAGGAVAVGGGRGGAGGGGAAGGGRGGRGDTSAAAVASVQRVAEQLRAAAAAGSATTESVAVANFGLTLACRPACTRAVGADGASYWRFGGYPTVGPSGAPRESAAGRAGIRDGDVLISVNGHSPLSDEGALLLSRAERELSLTLEVSRGGTRSRYTLRL